MAFFRRIIKRLKFGKLFYSNKFVMFFSIICSFVLWISVSLSSAESVPVTISDIPINVQLSQSATDDGLKIFSGQDVTARVEVTGSRMIVGQLTKNDIQVSAVQAASTIMSPGIYTLELSAKKVGLISDYNIISDVKPSVITVMVDRYREADFTIKPEIDFTPKEGYYVGSPILSSSDVKISGPETEVSKIKKVVVKGSVSGEVSQTVSLKLPVVMYDAYDQQIKSDTITTSFSEVDVSVPILTKKEIELKPTFSNVVGGINLKEIVKVNPSKLEIAGPEETIKGLESISLPEIDFKRLSVQNHKFDLSLSVPQGCRSLNNEYTVHVDVDMSQFKEKTLNIDHFSFINVPENKHAKVYNDSISVTFVGTSRSINALKSSDIVVQIDLNGKEDSLNSMEMPVKLIVNEFRDVWACGEYFANVSLSDKNE